MWIVTGALLGMLCVALVIIVGCQDQIAGLRAAHRREALRREVAEAQLADALATLLHDDFRRARRRVSEVEQAFGKAHGDGRGTN